MNINTIKQSVTLFIVAVLLTACTASVRVMPGPDEVNRVVARDIEKHGAEKAAHKAAVAYCEEQGMQAQFINDWVWYEGSMDEAQRAAIRRQSEAAIIIGGMVKSRGNEDAGIVIESAGVAGSSATSGKDYTAEIEFTCQVA